MGRLEGDGQWKDRIACLKTLKTLIELVLLDAKRLNIRHLQVASNTRCFRYRVCRRGIQRFSSRDSKDAAVGRRSGSWLGLLRIFCAIRRTPEFAGAAGARLPRLFSTRIEPESTHVMEDSRIKALRRERRRTCRGFTAQVQRFGATLSRRHSGLTKGDRVMGKNRNIPS